MQEIQLRQQDLKDAALSTLCARWPEDLLPKSEIRAAAQLLSGIMPKVVEYTALDFSTTPGDHLYSTEHTARLETLEKEISPELQRVVLELYKLMTGKEKPVNGENMAREDRLRLARVGRVVTQFIQDQLSQSSGINIAFVPLKSMDVIAQSCLAGTPFSLSRDEFLALRDRTGRI